MASGCTTCLDIGAADGSGLGAGRFRTGDRRQEVQDRGPSPEWGAKSEKGNAVVIVIGGAAESLLSLLGVNTVVMKQRKGFVRVALEFGADLMLVYSYGENNIFHKVIFSDGNVGWRLQQLFKKIMGFAQCLFMGEHWFWISYHCPVTTVLGGPFPVPKWPSPTQEEVDLYHDLYMEALAKLLDGHKASCGLSDSHELQSMKANH
nr:diacylglycerol O-acyltransferase 2-like [Oncorhynchus nerka]